MRSVAMEKAIHDAVETEYAAEEVQAQEAKKVGTWSTNAADAFVRHPQGHYIDARATSKTKKTSTASDAGSAAVPVTARSTTSYTDEDACTIWSSSYHTGEIRYPMSSVNAPHAPFGRSSQFTNPIQDPIKLHSEAMDEIDHISYEYMKEHH